MWVERSDVQLQDVAAELRTGQKCSDKNPSQTPLWVADARNRSKSTV